MLAASVSCLGNTSVLARTCTVRALTVVRPVVGQLISRSCSSKSTVVAATAVTPDVNVKGYHLPPLSDDALYGDLEPRYSDLRLFEISNKVTTPTSPLAKRCLRRVKQQAYSLLTARVTSDKVVAYNIARTSLDNKPPFGNSWIDLHERATGLRRDQQKCAVLGCNKAVTLGAHVEVVGQHEDMSLQGAISGWIAPYCSTHNHYRNFPPDKPMRLKPEARLVPLQPHSVWNFNQFSHSATHNAGYSSKTIAPPKPRKQRSTHTADAGATASPTKTKQSASKVMDNRSMHTFASTPLVVAAAAAAVDQEADATLETTAPLTGSESQTIIGGLNSYLNQGPGVFEAAGLSFVNGSDKIDAVWSAAQLFLTTMRG